MGLTDQEFLAQYGMTVEQTKAHIEQLKQFNRSKLTEIMEIAIPKKRSVRQQIASRRRIARNLRLINQQN